MLGRVGLSLVVLALAACSDAEQTEPTAVATPSVTATAPALADPSPAPAEDAPSPFETTMPRPPADASPATVWTTTHRVDGNRYVAGTGALPAAQPLDVALDAPAVWVLGVPEGGEPVWLVVDETGAATWVSAAGDLRSADAALAPGQPPVVTEATDGSLVVLAGGSPLTHPLPLVGGGVAVVDGQVRAGAEGEVVATAPPLPDARLVADENGRLLFLSGPTGEYGHAVLGDGVEASSVTVLDPATGDERTFELPDGLVAEGIGPIWADLDGDGTREIIVTLSDAAAGARIAVFDEDGTLLATGPAVGQGGRWRHQIAAAPFGPDGEIELVDVLTPHIGGIVEFYRWEGDRLEIVAQVPGFTSHVIGSRNLDLTLAADADGDGRVEVVVPAQDRTALGGIGRTADGGEVVWSVDLGGTLASNLAAVTSPDGAISFAAARTDGVLRIWPG